MIPVTWLIFPITFPMALPVMAADASGAIDLTVFAQFGAVGAIAVMGIWFARGAHQRERERADRLEAEVQRLHELMLERVIPAMTSASRAAEESAALILSMQRDREMTQLLHRQRPSPEGGGV